MKPKVLTFLSILATGGLIAGCSSSANSAPDLSQTTYEIYPKPQTIAYAPETFKISKSLNVVFESGIDKYTKKRLEKLLKSHNFKFTISEQIDADKTNIVVGINGSGELVDQYFNDQVKHDESFFEKIDAHLVSVDDQVIGVLGDDSDSAFYGLTTLKHIFNQLDQQYIREFRIDDYANVKHRGFIEGYYGNPWSNEDRADLMRFGGEYKLTTYFFAPKDDIYHNKKWRELYPEKELAEIRKLAKAGNESKCKYVYALHTFMHSPIRFDSEANYQADLDIIKAKFVQLLENDVRAFSILADDAGVPRQGPQTYVKLLEDLTDWLIEQKNSKYPDLVTDIPFCPNDYMGNGTSAQLREVNKAPDSTAIIMTGGRIWGEVSEHFTSNFIKNVATEGHPGRPSYLWINWPCSDNSKQHLILGGNDTFLHPGVTPSNIGGIILNPMQQAEANKSALFAIADYGWNIWDNKGEADQNWYDSFKYMNHGTAEETKSSTALREIAKHMINQNMDGRVRALQESVELAPKLDALKAKLKTGAVTKADTAALIKEFEALQQAAAYYKENPGNPRTRDQIIYWLNCWEDTTTAAINYLNCLNAVIDDNQEEIWNFYATAQAAFEKSKTYKFKYVNHFENAEVGVQHIVPFIKTMGSHLNEIVSGIVDPNKVIETYISNRPDGPNGQLKAITDGDNQTGVVYKSPNQIEQGQFVGLKFNNQMTIDEVDFELGTPANPNDTFGEARLEITKDGKTWAALNDTVYNGPKSINLDGLNLEAKGIRLIATKAKGNTWLGVREIVVNRTAKTVQPTAFYSNTDLNVKAEVTLDTAKLAPIKSATLQPNQFIGLKLDRIKELASLSTSGSTNGLTVEGSENGIEWTEKPQNARFVRLINKTDQTVRFEIDQFTITSQEIQPVNLVKSHAKVYNNSTPEQAFDGNFNSTVFFDKGFSKGESIVYDFGQALLVNNLKYVVLDTDFDHIRDAKFQLSLDGENWQDIFEIKRKSDNRDAKPQDNGYTHGSLSNGIIPISHSYLEGADLNTKARFVRILATETYAHRWIRISEILINNGDYIRTVNDPTFVSDPIELKGHGPEKMIDGDLTTSYRPNTQNGKIKSGSISYKLSENIQIGQINIVQDGNAISNAEVLVRTGKDKWQKLGKLSKSLNTLDTPKFDHIFEIKLKWQGTAPTIYQIVPVPVD